MDKVQILLPALNEEGSIVAVIEEIQALNLSGCGIVVVDNGSTDNTASKAKSMGAVVLRCLIRGKGNAIRYAIPQIDSDFVVMMDSDGTYPPACIPQMIGLLEHGFDIVVGKRKTCSMRFYNRICNIALSIPNYVIFGGKNNDICSGMWAFKTPALKDLALTATDFTLEADITTMAYLKHYKLWNMPIEYRKRIAGESKIKFKDGLKIASVMFKRALK